MYNDNKHLFTNENVFLIYEMMYIRNIYCHYIRRCIMIINISHYTRRCIFKNKYCHYIRRYIMTTNIFIIHESVYRLIRDDV